MGGNCSEGERGGSGSRVIHPSARQQQAREHHSPRPPAGHRACPCFLWLIPSPAQSEHGHQAMGTWGDTWSGRSRRQAQANTATYHATEFLAVTRWRGAIWPPFLGSGPKAGGVAILGGGRGDTDNIRMGVCSPCVRNAGRERLRAHEHKEHSAGSGLSTNSLCGA